jgi:hypothetical protein
MNQQQQRIHPINKKRISPGVVATGGLSRIMQGVFGIGSPAAGLAAQNVSQDAAKISAVYQFYEGDIFTPGTSNWVVDPSHDGPLMTEWGHAFLRTANTFVPLQTPQIYSAPGSYLYGVGGQVAGQLFTQPLSDLPTEGG